MLGGLNYIYIILPQYPIFDKKGRIVSYRGSMKIKSGAGQRLIVNAFVTRTGILEGSEDVFISRNKKRPENYHYEMNSDHYEVCTLFLM